MTHAIDAEKQAQITPDKALDMLKEGNKRFVEGKASDKNLMEQVHETAAGQHPFAVVLGCIDSRVPAEHIFDQGIGDIFNVRIAGNFVNKDILGSMEFGCKLAGAKIILVLGHTKCGAIKGACAGAELGNLTGMLENLKPAVKAVEKADGHSNDAEFREKVGRKNVELTVKQIMIDSPVLVEMAEAGEISIIGGMYNVETGQVQFMK